MGVQGLWELLAPVGRRVSVDTLGSRKLAIDASIWIVQFMKAMRDDKGDMIRNAHLLGFFRRICKLLFLRIKPVFVFDGATPALKRRTVIARRRQREQAHSKIRKTAEKLLLNHLRTRKLEEIAAGMSLDPQTNSKNDAERTLVDNRAIKQPAGSEAREGFSSRSLPADEYNRDAGDARLAASLTREYDKHGESGGGSAEGSDSDDDDGAEEQIVLPAVQGLDLSVLASLPPSMQLDLLVQMREQLVTENRQKFQTVAKVPASFSSMQIQAYLKTVAFRREINEVQKAAAGGGIGGVPTGRVASTTDREFIFSKSFQGEKPAPNEIEETRQAEVAPSSKPSFASLPVPSANPSVLFASMTGTQGQSGGDEDGVVSLVSTELNRDADTTSKSVVHTYIDERGNRRVNRRRGMGVHMTRDLQWNLYLMKDAETRKSGEGLVVGIESPRIILSNSGPFQNGSIAEEGLQISFADNEVSDASKGEDGDLFDELVRDGGDKDDRDLGIRRPSTVMNNVHMVQAEAEVINDEDAEDGVEWVDGGVTESRDGSVVEDRDLAEAMRLSLQDDQPLAVDTQEMCDQLLVEDETTSEESEVEWEDGTGDVFVADGPVNEEAPEATLVPNEEAELQEAIRRSLEDFRPPAQPAPQLVIKEPVDNTRGSHGAKVPSKYLPAMRAEAESEELYLARERTRKGKAVLGETDEESLFTVGRRPVPTISDQDQLAARTLSEMPVIEATMQTPVTNGTLHVLENDAREMLESNSVGTPMMGAGHGENEKPCFSIAENVGADATSAKVDQKPSDNPKSDLQQVSEVRQVSTPSIQTVEHLGREEATSKAWIPSSTEVRQTIGAGDNPAGTADTQEDGKTQLPCDEDKSFVERGRQPPLKAPPAVGDSREDLIMEAEEFEIALGQEELRDREAVLAAEMESLAREEADLQAEIEVEQEDIQAGLDREREVLAQEQMELRTAQKKNERNAESVTREMFTEIQDLLQMFGLPYLIAPMEAEAQCAYMDTVELVDGVVTDDSDVFLFGGRSVYKNLFDDRKYVETYYMKDLESEMGMSKEKLIRIAMLLGSDYTEGISGIGIVNAIEVVNAFSEDDGLRKFKEWLDAPDHALFEKAHGHQKGKGEGIGRGHSTGPDGSLVHDASNGSRDMKFTAAQQTFMEKHKAVSKNWNVPESFPSEAVVTAYINPAVDKSKETFTWGRPDLEALRRLCYERFAWSKDKADELLLPVLKEYDRRETQTRLESFYQFNQRFAKIRSSRIQKAITGMTGKRSAELMELPPHLETPNPKSSKKKVKSGKQKENGVPSFNEETEGNEPPPFGVHDPDDVDETHHKRGGRGMKGRRPNRGGKRASGSLESVEHLAGNVGEDGAGGASVRGGRGAGGRGRGGGKSRSRGRGRGRGRAQEYEEEASVSDSSDSDDVLGETLGESAGLERSTEYNQAPRRSVRKRTQVSTYQVGNSDEERDGTCSDGEELFKEVDRLVAEAGQRPVKQTSPALNSSAEAIGGHGQSHASKIDTGGFHPGEEAGHDPGEQVARQPSYVTSGGGFCLPEGDNDGPPDEAASSHVAEADAQGHDSNALGGGFCLSDEEAVVPPPEEGVTGDHLVENDQSGNSHADHLDEIHHDPPVMADTTASQHQILGVDASSNEPADFGLRAMPLMKRKRRRSLEKT